MDIEEALRAIPAVDVEKMSDGYHTFADLYEQRLILSAALAKNNPHAWKSKRHEDGSVPFGGGWFIMGFDTDEGCYTYHYELKDWDLFQCEELDKGKPWDGHTSKDVRRLLSIPAADVAPVVHGKRLLADMSGAKAVSLHDIYRVIAGHSYYHGDRILAALTCIVEGKEVNPVRPADVAPVVYCRHCRSYNKPRLGWCSVHLDCEGPDDFCGYGVRKDDDDAKES